MRPGRGVAVNPAQRAEKDLGAKEFAGVLYANTPGCADKTAALRKVREAVMTANAAIALKGLV